MIKRLLIQILANMGALYAIVMLLTPNFQITGGIKGYLVAAIIFGLLNSVAKPILKILSLPFIFITAGLFTLVINIFLVWFAQYALIILDFQGVALVLMGGWVTYLYVSILVSVANILIHWITKK